MRGFDFDKALVALQNELHCFAYKLTADKDEAENLLQETMLRTLDNKDKFDSGTGSVTPAFCAAKKSIFNFQPQSRAAPCISPAAPSGIARRRVREAAPYRVL